MRRSKITKEVGGKRWRDHRWTVHADGINGDTLCGLSLPRDGAGLDFIRTNRRITCKCCIGVIDASRAIRSRFINREHAR